MKKHIMVVDDSRFNQAMVRDALEEKYIVTCLSSGEEILKRLEEETPDLILLDIIMPQMDGIETMKEIQKRHRHCDIPIIFLTGETNNEVEAECLALGAQDFITKPFFKPTMLHRIDRILELEEFKRAAKKDALTGLWNRKYFEENVQNYLEKSEGQGAFFMLDVDNFKRVNDTYGHPAGDELLVQFSKLILSASEPGDLIGRLGGDEFAIFSTSITDKEAARKKSGEIVELVDSRFKDFDEEMGISTSVGISVADKPETEYRLLYKRADQALYNAKNNGKNTFCVE